MFALAACALLVFLGAVSLMADWQLVGISGWIWFVLALPELLLVAVLAVDAPRTVDVAVILVVVSANLCGLGLLIA